MANPITCSKCGGRMAEGSGLAGNAKAGILTRWIEGRPAYSLWSGLKVKGLKVLPVISYRCSRCGYLENYAND